MVGKFLLLGIAASVVTLSVSQGHREFNLVHHAEGCIDYEMNVTTKPNNRPKITERLDIDMEIGLVENVKRTSMYWCDLTIDDDVDGFRTWTHYYHNATHWTVKKGCSGTFRVVECKADVLERNAGIPIFVSTEDHAIVGDTPAILSSKLFQRESEHLNNVPTEDQEVESTQWMNLFGSIF